MKSLRYALLATALLIAFAPTTHAAFLRADVTELTWNRDASNGVIGVHFTIQIFDTATSEVKEFGYTIQGDELASLPPANQPAQRRAAVIVIMKRETKAVFLAWVADRASRVASTTPRVVATDLGTSSLTNTDETNPVP